MRTIEFLEKQKIKSFFNNDHNNIMMICLSWRMDVCMEVTKTFMNLPIAYEFYVRDDLSVTSVKVITNNAPWLCLG